ncbi:MAG: carbohydrate ABC transporter permease [Lachnospiraceae bacterium]|nr:carbohydrate ABC transporter permease [Lachnospiraceae bacterium]
MEHIVYKKSFGDHIFDFFIALFAVFVIVTTLYPLIYVFSMSISDPIAAARGQVWFLPVGFSLKALTTVLSDQKVLQYYGNTIWYTVVGTLCAVITSCLAAYPLSRHEFRARKFFTKFIMLTMFFNGGIIPTYLVVSRFLNLYDNRWVIVVMSLTSAWYVMITRSFFESLPETIIESARLDGASEYRIFLQLIMPLSKPIIAVLTLYNAVGHWNAYFNAMLYLSKKELQPIALYIREVVIQNSLSGFNEGELMKAEDILSLLQIKYAVIVVSVLPMLIIYPFISRNLEKGLMIGAVKG